MDEIISHLAHGGQARCSSTNRGSERPGECGKIRLVPPFCIQTRKPGQRKGELRIPLKTAVPTNRSDSHIEKEQPKPPRKTTTSIVSALQSKDRSVKHPETSRSCIRASALCCVGKQNKTYTGRRQRTPHQHNSSNVRGEKMEAHAPSREQRDHITPTGTSAASKPFVALAFCANRCVDTKRKLMLGNARLRRY